MLKTCWTIVNHCKWRILHLKVNRHFTQTTPTEIICLERIRNIRQIQIIETTWWLSLITNVKVVSRYIALGHDTYREPPYRYCIDISPYRLIPNCDPLKKFPRENPGFIVHFTEVCVVMGLFTEVYVVMGLFIEVCVVMGLFIEVCVVMGLFIEVCVVMGLFTEVCVW